MTYTVKYRKGLVWRRLRNVKGDGIVEHNRSRFFILEDETRYEIPLEYEFRFSKERFFMIKEQMEQEIGQELKIRR